METNKKLTKEDKHFIKKFESKVKETIKKYNLATKKDKIIVGCSGGKDSTTVLYLLNKWNYNVEAITINLEIGEWSKKNLENLRNFCSEHKIKLHVVDIRDELGSSMCHIRAHIQSKAKLSNCMICGIIKKWLLNKKSRELKATRLVTGHNMDDIAETLLMNMFKGNPKLSLSMTPKTGIIENERFVQRIKPLYFCLNDDIKKYSQIMNFSVLYELCPCSSDVFRRQIRNELNKLEKKYPNIKQNIVNHFLETLPQLRKFYQKEIEQELKTNLNSCKICGEPCRGEVCRNCWIIRINNS